MGFINEKCFRKFAIFVILSCCAIYTCVYLDFITDRWMYTTTKLQNAYFVNLPGCRMISLDVMNPTIETYTKDNGPKLKCKQSSWFRPRAYKGQWFLEFNLIKLISEEKEKYFDETKASCSYWPMKRKPRNDYSILRGEEVPFELVPPYRIAMPEGTQFISVVCRDRSNRTLHQDVHFFVQPPPGDLLIGPKPELKKWGTANGTKEKDPLLSVMILGLDSLSHLNFLRQMPKTQSVIRNVASHVEFWGFNKINWNTYPILIPLLTGLSAKELEVLCYYPERNESFDSCPLIWKDYKKAGFNTSFAEDDIVIPLFNYLRSGFKNQPTDHYLRPILLAMNKFRLKYSNNRHVKCAGGRTYGDMILEQIEQLLPHKQRYPFFSFYWWIQGIQEQFNFAKQIDTRFADLLYKLNVTGILNNTFIVFMSDHGMRGGDFRRTYQGMLEESQPLLFTLYPNWLRQRYPLALHNLHKNHRSLITTFDLHETLVDLLDLKALQDDVIRSKTKELWNLTGESTPRGSSLFLPLPPWRNCVSSNIPSSCCLCHKLSPVSTDDNMVQRSGRTIVKSINELLKPYPQCHQLKLREIVNAYQTSLAEKPNSWFGQPRPEMEFKIRLQTMPGGAFFESTTRSQGFTLMLVDEIIRLGENNNNTFCIDDPNVEKYCDCALR